MCGGHAQIIVRFWGIAEIQEALRLQTMACRAATLVGTASPGLQKGPTLVNTTSLAFRFELCPSCSFLNSYSPNADAIWGAGEPLEDGTSWHV